jgi:hypothetical protein
MTLADFTPIVPAPKAVFNAAAEAVLAECSAICTQRGGEYRDSWHLDNQQVPFLDHVHREIGHGMPFSPEEKRLIVMASIADVKISRLAGAFKRDTYVDLINYVAALCSLLERYVEAKAPSGSKS